MDDLFGEENFVAQMVWAQGRKSMAAQVAINHEYCLVYCKNRAFAISVATLQGREDWLDRKDGLEEIYAAYDLSKEKRGDDNSAIEADIQTFYESLDDDSPSLAHQHYNCVDQRGLYFPGDISQGTGNGGRFDIVHPLTKLPCKVPAGGWRFSEDKLPILLSENRIHFGSDHQTIPCLKRYLRETENEVTPSVFYRDGRGASKRLSKLLGAKCFEHPKDEQILAKFVRYVTSRSDPNPVILDFFAGSGSLGHAVMAQNIEDGGNRRFILVQLPEPLDPENKDQKAAISFCDRIGKSRNVAEITKERLRLMSKKLLATNPIFAGDLGFRVFKLASSNINAWEPERDDLPKTLQASAEHLKIDRTEQDILFEVLLKLGLDLCVPIEKKVIAGKAVHSIGGGVLIACLSTEITNGEVEPLSHGVVEWHKKLAPAGETTCIFRDSAFVDDVAKTNLTAILQQNGLETIRSL